MSFDNPDFSHVEDSQYKKINHPEVGTNTVDDPNKKLEQLD
jgi:hypothetical protein